MLFTNKMIIVNYKRSINGWYEITTVSGMEESDYEKVVRYWSRE